MKKRIFSIFLALAILVSILPNIGAVTSAATDNDGFCPHHTEHNEDCGYDERIPCGYVCEICTELTEETDAAEETEATEGKEETLDIATPSDAVETPASTEEEEPEVEEPAPVAENKVQYHLNQQMIPGVSGDGAVWYESETIAELADISNFSITNGQYTANGTTYYFAGWHIKKLYEGQFTSYADIAYPVMVPSTDKRELNVQYPTEEIPPNNSAGEKKLYAVWVPESNRYLFGYTMILPGATFPGVDPNSYDADTWYTIDGQRLGNNGLGSAGFQKFTILDDGHNNGVDEDPLTVTSDMPTAAGTANADYTFIAWFNKTPGNTYKKYVLQGGDHVTYSGTNIYSIDAVWGLVNGANNVSKAYDGQAHHIDIDALTTSFLYGSYTAYPEAENTAAAFFAADDSLTSGGTEKNDHLVYYVTVTYNGQEVVSEKKLESASDLPEFSEVGTYVYTITAKLVDIDPTNGRDPDAKPVTITVDSDTATLTILPTLTFHVELGISPSWDDLAGNETFTFTLSAEDFGSITATVDQSSHSVTFDKPFEFSEADIGKTYQFTVVQTPGNLSYIAYDTTPKTVNVSIVKDQDGKITLEFTGDGTIGNTDGNTYSCTFAFENRILGDLTVSKTVKGDAGDTNKDFTFTVKLSDTTISGSYGDMDFTSGEATFALKHGQSKTATGLPAGITYTVTEVEANQDGYSTTSVNASGTIQVNQTVRVEFVNSKESPKPETEPTPTSTPEPDDPTDPTPAPTPDRPMDDVPKTGDESKIVLWTVLALLSLTGMIVTLFSQKKIQLFSSTDRHSK